MPRFVSLNENRQRGCRYCLYVSSAKRKGQNQTACPFEECQFAVLDKYNTYEEFMESEDSKILVTEFFKTVATIYELSANPTRTKCLFSDGNVRW